MTAVPSPALDLNELWSPWLSFVNTSGPDHALNRDCDNEGKKKDCRRSRKKKSPQRSQFRRPCPRSRHFGWIIVEV